MELQHYFNDKTCVVTGAASGIGFAVSRLLLASGAKVFMADRDIATLENAVFSLGALTARAYPAVVDVTSQEQVAGVVQDAVGQCGRLDALFNNAGIPGTAPIETATLADWRRIIDSNLWGVIHGIDAVLPIMRRQGGGHIVNTASLAGLIPPAFQSLYAATKFAVAGLSESLRYELGDTGIHVSVVCPGNVASNLFGVNIAGEYREALPSDDAITAQDAAAVILDGVMNRQGIIVFPEPDREFWRRYWRDPEACEPELWEEARQRRENLRETGSIF